MPKKKQVVEPVPEVIEPTVVETNINETVLDVAVPPDSTPHEAPAPSADEALSTLPPDEVKEVKVKAKRKPQPKKIEVKEIQETTEEPKKKVKTLEQVQCDTCEKDMTKRTLRYHHKCPGEVIKREEIPVKKELRKKHHLNQKKKQKHLKNQHSQTHIRKDCKKH